MGFVLAAAVEVGHHAEAAAAVLDEGADGGAPSPLRFLRRVLGREIEVLPQALLQPVHPSLPSLPQERRARRGREQREEMDGEFEFERCCVGKGELARAVLTLEYKKEQPLPARRALTFWFCARRAGRSPSARGCCLRGESASVRRRRAQGPAGRNCFGTPVRLMGCPGATKAMDSTLGHHRKTSYY